MELLDRILLRKSHNRLVSPAPSKEAMEKMFQAALRAPDHALLKPWRYRVYQGAALELLGQAFVNASLKTDPALTSEKQLKIKSKPLRAPMVVVASAVIKEHPKVPREEQLLSAGASVQNLIMCAHLLSVGAMWRTGDLAFNRHLMTELGMEPSEEIVGFVYLGTEDGIKKPVPEIAQNDFVEWI